MITRLTAAIVALLAFAGMILAGLAAGNPVETVLMRALIGLVIGLAVGHVAGLIGQRIVHEYFEKMIERDAQAELAAAGVGADGPAPSAQAEPAGANVAGAADVKAAKENVVADVAQEAPSESRQEERLTRARTLSLRAAREMQRQL
jgi:hypothetical protein